MSWWILTLIGLMLWLRRLKNPMNPLAWWRTLDEALWPTFDGLMVLKGDDVAINDLMKDWNPWWRSQCLCIPCWGHITIGDGHYAWEGLTPTYMATWWPLDTVWSLMVHLEMIWVLEPIHMVIWKPMIVGAFDMMEYLVMTPSSLGDRFLCYGLEIYGKYIV